MSAPKRRSSWLRILFSLALLAVVCASIDWKEETALLHDVAWEWVIAATLPHLFNRLISATKWQILLRAKGLSYSYGELLSIIWVSNFFGHFLPSAVGGDSLRMWQVARRSTRAPDAVSTVFVERLTGVISLAGLAIVGGVWSWARWGKHLVFVALLAPSAALLVILGLLWTAPGERLLEWLLSHFHKLPGHAFLTKATEAVHSFRGYPGAMLQALVISGIIQLNRVFSVYCLARALGLTLFFGEAMVVVPAALFIAMLPLSMGGLGLHEGAFIVFLGLVGVTRNAAFAISLLSRIVTLSSNLPGAVLFLLESVGFRHDHDRSPGGADPSRPLRALWLADKLGYGDRLHGLGQYYLTMVPALREIEVVPVVFRAHENLQQLFAARGIRLRRLPHQPCDPRIIWALARLIRAEGVDLIQVHGYGASIVGRLAGWLTRTPVVLRQGDMEPEPWFIREADRHLNRLTSRTVAISESVKRFCVTERGIAPGRITVISHAIHTRPAAAPEELRLLRQRLVVPVSAPLIGSVTRFHAVKGVRHLIEAMPAVLRAVPEAHLILWGDGSEHEALRAQAQALGVAEQVRFAGFDPEAARYLGALRCFVLPSIREGFSFALLEAMTAGCPIVASQVGGIPEVVRHEREALLVPAQDPEALARAILAVLTDDRLAQRLGAAARQASAAYTMERHTARLHQVYREALAEVQTNGAGHGR